MKDGREPSGLTQKLMAMTPDDLARMTAATNRPVNPMDALLPAPQANPKPEFSIIICSPPKNDEKFNKTRDIYQQTLAGERFEIIRIDDARSLAEGYNRGVHQARGTTIVFSHDDAAPVRPFAARLRSHLRSVDIVGGAGSDRLDGPAWFTAGPPHVFGQVLNQMPPVNGQPPFNLSVYGVPSALVENMQVLDGFWMATTLEVAQDYRFDAVLCDGFHLYDIDWSYRAYCRGLNVGVACDLSLMHASSGGYGDPKWRPAADKWMQVYGAGLPAHQPRGFQFGACVSGDPNELLSVMDGMVERTR